MDWGLLGILAIMMLPMIAGGITLYYSELYTAKRIISDTPPHENTSDH